MFEGGSVHTYRFSGRVHPERANVHVPALPALAVEVPEASWHGTVRVSIAASQLSLVFEGTATSDLMTLKNAAYNLAQSITDVLCYHLGHAYSVEIVAVVSEENEHLVFPVTQPSIAASRDDRPLELGSQLFRTVLNSPHLRRSLGDLRRAVREPLDTAFHCQRAVECLRHHFQVGDNKSAAWEALRSTLRVREETLRQLAVASRPQRHGEPSSAIVSQRSAEERDSTILLAWSVVDRFVVYIDGDEVGIDEHRFPWL